MLHTPHSFSIHQNTTTATNNKKSFIYSQTFHFFTMMFMLNSAVTMVTFATVVSVLVTTLYGRVLVGEKTDMGDVRRNKDVQELGRFSVEEYNEKVIGVVGSRNNAGFGGGSHQEVVGGGNKVEFMKVVKAKKQVVEGTKYYLKIWGVDEKGRYREFDSVVEVKPWLNDQNAKKLLSFTPSRQYKRSDQKDDDVSDESVWNKNKKFISSV